MQFGEVKELIAIFEKTDLNDMEVQLDNAIVRLNRGRTAPMAPAIPAMPRDFGQQHGPESVFVAGKTAEPASDISYEKESLTEEEIDNLFGKLPADENEKNAGPGTDNGKIIKSPIVGTFYQSASPEKPPYVNVGDTVAKGDIVCIIEAMKFMNEVASEENGKIVEIFVEDGQFVEYGAPLFRLV